MRTSRRQATTRRATLAALLGSFLAFPSLGRSAPCPEIEDPRRANLVVDTSALIEDSAIIQERVREGLAVLLREFEILPAKRASEPELKVELWQIDREEYRYGFAITLERGEERAQKLRHSGECESCTEGEIVSRVLSTIDTLATDLCAATAPETDDQPPVEPISTPPRPRVEPTMLDDEGNRSSTLGPSYPPDRVQLRPVGKAGIASLSVGAVAVAVGTILALREPTPLEDRPLFVRTTETPGIAVASVGASLVLTGAILLLVHRRRSRRARDPSFAARSPIGASPP